MDTTAWTAPAGTVATRIQTLAATVIASYTDESEVSGSGSLASLPANMIVEGRFTALTLTSGAVRLHITK